MSESVGPRIVVGVDGSEGSLRALRYAIVEARLRGATLEVIHGWHVPYYGDFTGVMPYPGEELASAAETVLHDMLSCVEDEAQGVTITARAVESPPAFALTEAGKDADLIVVGRRGHGGFLGLLLGSVAQQVASHATCPVVLVPVE